MKTKFDHSQKAQAYTNSLCEALVAHFPGSSVYRWQDDTDNARGILFPCEGDKKGVHISVVDCYHNARVAVSGLWPEDIRGEYAKSGRCVTQSAQFYPSLCLPYSERDLSCDISCAPYADGETLTEAANRIAKAIKSRCLPTYEKMYAYCAEVKARTIAYRAATNSTQDAVDTAFAGLSYDQGLQSAVAEGDKVKVSLYCITLEQAQRVAAALRG